MDVRFVEARGLADGQRCCGIVAGQQVRGDALRAQFCDRRRRGALHAVAQCDGAQQFTVLAVLLRQQDQRRAVGFRRVDDAGEIAGEFHPAFTDERARTQHVFLLFDDAAQPAAGKRLEILDTAKLQCFAFRFLQDALRQRMFGTGFQRRGDGQQFLAVGT